MKRWAAAALLLPALARWLLMVSPAPYKAVLPASWFAAGNLGLARLSFNALWCTLLLIVAPLLLVRGSLWRPMLALDAGVVRRGLGWAAGGAVLAFALGWGARLAAPSLCAHYPLHASWAGELLYVVVILATEVFYRGVLLTAWSETFGRWALPAMAVVCALDHIGAPAIEVISSGFGALLLGWIAQRTRSIWPGFAMHASLALAVDAGCWRW